MLLKSGDHITLVMVEITERDMTALRLRQPAEDLKMGLCKSNGMAKLYLVVMTIIIRLS